jgi:predicted phosphoribosyltransferase
MAFQSRLEAAERLAQQLARYRSHKPLVLGIPRGAVPMARVIADALEGDLDVVLVHKLRAPDQPEFAIGSVSESGHVYVSELAERYGIPAAYIEREVESQLADLRHRRALYTPVRPPIPPRGRIVIVVDDGVATGWTMIAALRAVRALSPQRLIAALGVAPAEAIEKMEKETDEVCCLECPEYFYAVGQFFEEFPQVTDDEVIEQLKRVPAAQR